MGSGEQRADRRGAGVFFAESLYKSGRVEQRRKRKDENGRRIQARGKKSVTPTEVDPIYRALLENRLLTTGLLEHLTGAAIVVAACTRMRMGAAFRCSVLTAEGEVMVLARAAVNGALLPGAAVRDILRGEIPLGRIIARHVREQERCNFSCFTLQDSRLAPILYGRLADSPDGENDGHAVPVNRCLSGSILPDFRLPEEYRRNAPAFPGRSYDIVAGKGRIARIEEIFSPQIREKVEKRKAEKGRTLPGKSNGSRAPASNPPCLSTRNGHALPLQGPNAAICAGPASSAWGVPFNLERR